MALLSHITAPDSVILAAAFSLGMLAGVAIAWFAGKVWTGNRR